MWENFWNTLLSGDLLLALFQLVLALIGTIVTVIMYPIGLLITTLMPDQTYWHISATIELYFDYATTYISWIIDAFAVPHIVLTIIASYYLFRFSLTFGLWTIKLFVKWKQAIWH